MSLKPGDIAPDFTLPGGDGTDITLSAFAGKPVVVYFYPKDDTPGCTTEAIDFSARIADFAALGCTVIGISKDTAAKHAKFAAKHDLKVQLAADVDGKVIEAWGVWIEKKLYGRAYMGIERATFLLDGDRKVREVWHSVKVKGHADAVLETAKALA
ncbi:thioredoxin-dependent thiol peroxidase [Gimibacter soli]|uniref:thioredoxin-dependent peroxiredoxin n=1 Tax=Gimibacter soli TaxID=3024400 RepID=A0AAE9XPN6_9PROT|nr:thioredoxin-dependent thiol peroxidase [Gimibacter soli]WCL52776.1 thioredoxin-dependent thiol peroxidase [Gimibacter soli]